MRTPPPAYFSMREAYARWFWKLPAGLLLLVLAMVAGRSRQSEDPRSSAGAQNGLSGILYVGAAALLLDSMKDRAVYESNKGIYQSTPDSMP